MGSIIVVTAPSGCGKSTLINAYMKADKNASFAISHTTRAMRGSEQDGVEYHFIDEPTFKQMIAGSEFVEWALVHDNYYGTSKQELESVGDGKTLILDIDVQGAVALQKMNVEALFVFIKPPSIEDLKRRLVGRNTDTEDVIEKRLWNARRELEYAHLFHTVIVNSELEKAQKEFDEVISAYQQRVVQTAQAESVASSDNEKLSDNEQVDTTSEQGVVGSEAIENNSESKNTLESDAVLDSVEESAAADDTSESLALDDSIESMVDTIDTTQELEATGSSESLENEDIGTDDEGFAADVDDENKELNAEG